MTSFITPAGAAGGDPPRPAEASSPAAILDAETAARRRLTHALGVELRRRLIPLVRANLIPLDAACRVLQDAGLAPLPRMWKVRLTPAVTRQAEHTSLDQAVTTSRDLFGQAVRQALGPAATIAFERPPQALAAGPRDRAGYRLYDIWSQSTVTALVRAETGDQARTKAVVMLRDALYELSGVMANVGTGASVQAEPDQPVELNVDTDAPHQLYPTPPSYTTGVTEARAARHLAMQAWQHQVRRIRAALIDALATGELDGHAGGHGPYGLVDDLLRDLGLSGLPHAHLYEIAAAIPLTVIADNPAAARLAAYRVVGDGCAVHPQDGLPITVSSTFREPDIVAAGEGGYLVTWHETYLVCLRATGSPRLAEHAVRLQLSVLAEQLPDIAAVPLTTVYLGEHIDHRLDPNRD